MDYDSIPTMDSILNALFPWRKQKREKLEQRAVLGQKRRILKKEQVEIGSQEVVAKLLKEKDFQEAKRVMLYYPLHNEIDLRSLLDEAPDKEYFLPVTHRKGIEIRRYAKNSIMRRGKTGVPEPQGETYKGPLDIVLVPGIGFSKQGARLGRGGGYYDRFLKKHHFDKKWGVGYKFQLTPKIPTLRWDVLMDKVIVADSE